MDTFITNTENLESMNYEKKTTYIKENEYINMESDLYLPLPEEYDIFTQIDPSLFFKRDTKQYELVSNCLKYLRRILQILYKERGVVCVLPKLIPSYDDRGTILFNWAYSTFRAFLSFENENGRYDAFCGIVYQSDENSVSTQTRKINDENYMEMIDELLQLVINNS